VHSRFDSLAHGSSLISTRISRANAGLLLVGGLALLFAPDVILPRFIPTFPAAAAWLGQLLAAAWLALAALNWLNQSALLGGIYARPVVLTNAALYFIAAMVLLKVVRQPEAPAALWLVIVPVVLFAGIYGWLLFRGPLDRDFEIHRRAQ
jgi:hypothetical protein